MARRFLSLALAALIPVAALAATPPAGHVNFVACPILQDTATVPCWMADYQGQRYYLTIQTDASGEIYPPFLGHQALIEGVVSDEPNICGGKVLKPVKISVLPDLDPACNVMLPDDGRYTVPFAPRGPGPRAPVAELIARGLREAQPPGGARPPPPSPPFVEKTFTLYFEYDAQRATRSIREMQAALVYAEAIKARRVEIMAWRAAPLLSNGERPAEPEWLAERRARELAAVMADIGIDPRVIKVTWRTAAVNGDGVDDWQDRRATIRVMP